MLPEGEVHVWLVPVAHAPEPIAILDGEERERAGRFRVDAARRRFVVSHGALRLVLSRLTGLAPESLRFTRRCGHCGSTDHGKPHLSENSGLDFSLSHSGGFALIAVARGRRVGADLERVRGRTDVVAIARRAFPPAERVEIESRSTDDERRAAFFRCWTRKEAYLKARGVGLAGGLDSVAGAGWRVRSLRAPAGYAAAVAAESQFALRQRTTLWPPEPEAVRETHGAAAIADALCEPPRPSGGARGGYRLGLAKAPIAQPDRATPS
jgi:4'-phosphopantetheinyl transferase